jgi:succinoglycan biosynthesis transport protein ExoP
MTNHPVPDSGRPRWTSPAFGDPRSRAMTEDGFYTRFDGPPAYPPRLMEATEPSERSLAAIMGMLWKRKLLIVSCMLGMGILAYGISLMMPVRYSSQGILAIDSRPLYMPQLGTGLQPIPPDTAIARSEAQILKSRALLATVAKKLELDKDPDLNPYLRDPSPIAAAIGRMTGWLEGGAQWIGLIDPDENGVPIATPEDIVWSEVVASMLKRLDIRTDGKSYVIYVEFESDSPTTSASVVNTLMKSFIEGQITSSSDALVEANSWVKQRAEDLRKEVDAADQKVQQYRTQYGLVETRNGTVSSQQLSELNSQLALARADRSQAEARFQQAKEEARNPNGGDTTSEVLSSLLVQRLREREAEIIQRQADMSTRLGSAHPQVQSAAKELADLHSQIRREIGKVLVSLEKQVEIARTRERSIDAQLRDLQGRATKSAESEVGLRSLEKEADTKRNVYQTFLSTAQQTAEPSRINQANTHVVSSAIAPVYPFSPRKKLFAIGGMFIGFLLAAALSLLFAELDRGFETVDELERKTGLPVLGVIPIVRRGTASRGNALPREVVDSPHSATSETLRGIRVALKSKLRRRPAPVVLVTSAEPGEGKTSVASALGFLAARDGFRILIVDSDLRRPRLHRLFRAEPGPSLQDVLRGSESWLSAVRTDAESGADCLTAYDRTDSPVSLLTSGHWQEFLSQARRAYDLIILDSPPIMKVADALTLADFADAVVLVVAYKATQQRVLAEAMRRFEATRRPIVGAVLSKVAARKVPNEQYYSGYAVAGTR